MILKMYSIRDAKAGIFHKPFYQVTHGEAERSFRTTCSEKQSMMWQYPEDFDLYYVGEYNDNEGTMKPLDTPQHILKAIACVKKEKDSSAEEN